MVKLVAMAWLFACAGAIAQPIGPAYDIREPDMLQELHQRLAELQASGALERAMREGARRAEASARTPRPVDGVRPAKTPRQAWYDPTWVADRDVTLPDGTVLARRGERINPLQHVRWPRPWVFIDGRRPQEVRFAKAELARGPARVILVAGDWAHVAKQLGVSVFFDQSGFLVNRLGIGATPARVVQDGLRLRIEEVPLHE